MRVKKTVVTEPGEQPGEQPDLIGAGQGDPREKEDLNTELDCRLWLPPLQKRVPSLALFFFKFIYFWPHLGESHGQRSLVGYSPQGCKESDTTERLHTLVARRTLASLPCIEPVPPTLQAWSLNHLTAREVPSSSF